MQAIYAWECGNTDPNTPDTPRIITQITDIDSLIRRHAPKWPLEKINKVDLAILRNALWEMLNLSGTPQKVIIDESIELAKEFGSQSSSSFINGVLGSAIKDEFIINQHDHQSTPTSKS